MTPAELKAEHEYRYAERCAISGCYTSPVPGRVHSRAYDEADEAIAILKGEKPDPMKDLWAIRQKWLKGNQD